MHPFLSLALTTQGRGATIGMLEALVVAVVLRITHGTTIIDGPRILVVLDVAAIAMNNCIPMGPILAHTGTSLVAD